MSKTHPLTIIQFFLAILWAIPSFILIEVEEAKQFTWFFISIVPFIGLSVITTYLGWLMIFKKVDIVYPFEVKKVILTGDIQLAYAEEGNGKQTIIFIHGLGSYLPAWKKNVESLKDSYRCIAIDLPGYGKSSKGNYSGMMEFYAEIIQEFCKSKALNNIILCGHSMGGQIAITAALKYPHLIQKLILIAPAGFETFNKGEKQWFRDVMTVDGVRLTSVEQIKTNLAYNFYNMPDDAKFMIDDRIDMRDASDFNAYCYSIVQSVKGMVDQPVYEFLPQVKQATLCIFGENDNLIPNRYLNGGFTRRYAKKGANRLPDCSLIMIPHAGHFVMFEKSEEVNAFIKNFIK